MKYIRNHPKGSKAQTKLMYIIMITFGDILDLKDFGPKKIEVTDMF